jgi:hypothetical protein
MVGAMAMLLGDSFPMLMASRFVTSVSIRFALITASVYAMEIALAIACGLLNSMLYFFNIGAWAGRTPNSSWASRAADTTTLALGITY